MDLKKLALGTGAAILTSGLIGGAAFAALAPASSAAATAATTSPAGTARGDTDEARRRGAGLEGILDKLVAAGKINLAQKADILAAVKDAGGAKKRPDHSNAKAVLGDLLNTAAMYLHLDRTALATQLHAGKSLGEIAGPSRDGLLKALTDAATARIDAAITANKLTADQATKLKAGLATHLTRLVDHKAGARPEHPKKP